MDTRHIEELTTADQLTITAGDYEDMNLGIGWGAAFGSGSALLFGAGYLSGTSVLLWQTL